MLTGRRYGFSKVMSCPASVMVPDVDAWWRRAAGLGARVLAPIADRYYGLRDFTIADPDGFGIRFASRIQGAQEDLP